MIINVDRKTRGINLSVKAKDQAEQHEAMQKFSAESNLLLPVRPTWAPC